MVRLPRLEYFAYWARDPVTGAYTGTEPEGEGLKRLKARMVDTAVSHGEGVGGVKSLSLLQSRSP